MKLKYPRLSCSMDKRKKICDSDVKKILKLHKNGMMIKDIAKKFNVSYNTILRKVNPKFYQEQLVKSRVRDRKRYAEDPAYRKSQIKEVTKYFNKRYKTDAEFRKYHIELVKAGR